MAKANVKVTKEIILTLSEEEAEFIKALTQNPPVYLEKENPLREAIWEALDGLL